MATVIKSTRIFSDDLMQRNRQQGDPIADAVIATIAEDGNRAAGETPAVGALMRWLGTTANLSLAASGVAEQHPTVQAFFEQNSALPDWADPVKMAQGMTFFQKHAGQISLILGCFSLPYCYLGANGAQLLWLTERIRNDTARRLQETGEWVFGIMNPKEWLPAPFRKPSPLTGSRKMLPQPGELNAVTRTLKVRLIHAGARWFALHSGRWDMGWGYPVNQEDMAGTNLAFSYIVVKGLRQTGITTSEADEEAYLHHVNVAACINGVAEELLPRNLREAYQIGQAIARRQFQPSEAGQGLTNALLNAIGQQVSQAGSIDRDTARNLAAGEMRFFMGDRHANMLGVPAAALEKRLLGLINRLPVFPNALALGQ